MKYEKIGSVSIYTLSSEYETRRLFVFSDDSAKYIVENDNIDETFDVIGIEETGYYRDAPHSKDTLI